jgi:hypothetical protein
VTPVRCDRHDCDDPVKARGLCNKHYLRERDRPQRQTTKTREDAILRSRARARALAKLARLYPDEYQTIYQLVLQHVHKEAQALLAVAPDATIGPRGVVLLRRGIVPTDQDIEDRIVLNPPGICPSCARVHDGGHHCPHCGAQLGEPRTGQRLRSDGLIDQVSVERAVRGEPVRLTPEERLVAVKMLVDRGAPVNAIAVRLRLSGAATRTLIREVAARRANSPSEFTA